MLAELALLFDPTRILRAQRFAADPWQRDLLLCNDRYLLLNCTRQAGKSTVVAALALHQMLLEPGCLVLLVAPAERQSQELFRKVIAGWQAISAPVETRVCNQHELELSTGSRLVALPGREGTIRSFSGVRLLILDEASRVPDDLYRSVRPMLAVSGGRLVALSTPFGQRGWFYDEWVGQGPWRRFRIPWTMCPRIDPAFVADERRALGDAWVAQEYEAAFTTMEGLVYPDFPQAIVEEVERQGRRVGGIDFGWRNPFAAIWGFLDADDVLWIEAERYGSQTTLADHAAHLPREVIWYADPAGAADIAELRRRDYRVLAGRNDIRRGIALVAARLRTGRLKVARSCVHLLKESRLYRYPSAAERAIAGENPIDENNHAMAALRYLISRLPERIPRETPSEKSARQVSLPDDEDDGWMRV
ncbi:MAG: hypothetical protein K2X38_01980 [Gemmataceae bacterium]|nr:hypothetical protein [Gemmataceae bacterium]